MKTPTSSATYHVLNITGGTLYAGNDLARAIAAAADHWGDGAVRSARGWRLIELADDGEWVLGRWRTADEWRPTE